MIRLRKGAEPEILRNHAAAWRDQYLELRARGGTRRGRRWYGRPEIKHVLMEESAGKCVYCESKVTHVYPGDVEHILPVAARPELICVWENLAFVCSICNNNKRDYFDEARPLLNPFVEKPEDHIYFYGALVCPVPNDERGYLTVRRLKLDRQGLMERRTAKLEELRKLIESWKRAEGSVKEAIAEEMLEAAGRDKEYTAASMAFLEYAARKFGVRFGGDGEGAGTDAADGDALAADGDALAADG